MRMSSVSRSGHFIPRKKKALGIYWPGGWVRHWAGLDVVVRRKFSYSGRKSKGKRPAPSPVTITTVISLTERTYWITHFICGSTNLLHNKALLENLKYHICIPHKTEVIIRTKTESRQCRYRNTNRRTCRWPDANIPLHFHFVQNINLPGSHTKASAGTVPSPGGTRE